MLWLFVGLILQLVVVCWFDSLACGCLMFVGSSFLDFQGCCGGLILFSMLC